MPPELGQETVPLFLSRVAALAAIEAEQKLIARPIEFGRIFLLCDPNPRHGLGNGPEKGKLPKYLKGILHAATSSQFLHWLAATQGILRADCGEHCYPNCITRAKKCSRRNRRKRYEQPASAWPTRQTPADSPLPIPIACACWICTSRFFAKVRRKRKPRKSSSVVPIAPSLEPAA